MRRRSKKRMSQLLKGLFIGLFLLGAIITTTNFLDKGKNKYVSPSPEPQKTEIPAPTISIASEKNKGADAPDNTEAGNDSNAKEGSTTEESTAKEEDTAKSDTYQPTLEGEQTAEDIAAKIKAEQENALAYGFLKATAINPKSKQALKVNFTIFNDKNIKVIEGDSTNNPSFKLPVGRYRVVATLLNLNNQKNNAESSENIVIREDEITRKTFKVAPQITIGVLQVSAINANNKKSLRANFTIQKESGETVATRQNVSSTLFKLDSGSYKVTVTSGQNSDSRTIVIDAGGSSKEVFRLQEASKQGKLLVRALEGRSDNKVAVDISISNENDEVIHNFSEINQTEITLPVGNYSIKVSTNYAHANKNIHVAAGKTLNEIFRFEPPEPAPSTKPLANEEPVVNEEPSANKKPLADKEPSDSKQPANLTDNKTATTNDDAAEKETSEPKKAAVTTDEISEEETPPKEVAITDDVKITAVDTTKINNDLSRIEKTQKAKDLRGSIKIIANNSSDSSPIKSNFYIQTLSGKHIAKKIYADNAKFELEPGTYKVTVRANKRNNLVKTIEIRPNKLLTTTFLLEKSSPTATQASSPKTTRQTPKASPVNNSGTGFLRVLMRPSGNMRANDHRLNSHFVVYKKSGEKVVELTDVKRANFKLDVGEYKVSAINNRSAKSQTIRVRSSQVTNISFNLADFKQAARRATPPMQAPQATPQRTQPQHPANNVVLKGGLRSHIVNQAGQHLKGNLTVRDKLGRVVARANNVSVGVFNLPPARYTIVLEYRDLHGSEKVNIITGETTVQTFTLAQ